MDLKDDLSDKTAPSFEAGAESILVALRLLGAGLGLMVVIVGLWCGVKVFADVFGLLNSPQGFGESFEAWRIALGGDDLAWKFNDQRLDYGRILAMVGFWVGKLLLAWLSLGMLLTGAKMIAWTTGDQHAVKRILDHAIGTRWDRSQK